MAGTTVENVPSGATLNTNFLSNLIPLLEASKEMAKWKMQNEADATKLGMQAGIQTGHYWPMGAGPTQPGQIPWGKVGGQPMNYQALPVEQYLAVMGKTGEAGKTAAETNKLTWEAKETEAKTNALQSSSNLFKLLQEGQGQGQGGMIPYGGMVKQGGNEIYYTFPTKKKSGGWSLPGRTPARQQALSPNQVSLSPEEQDAIVKVKQARPELSDEQVVTFVLAYSRPGKQ